MLVLDGTWHVKIAVNSTYCLLYRRIEPDYEAVSFPSFARIINFEESERLLLFCDRSSVHIQASRRASL